MKKITRFLVLGVVLIMCLGFFGGCGNTELKQGIYVTTDDELAIEYAWVKLYDDNQFAFDRGSGTSYCPTGNFSIKKGILILHVTDDEEYFFDIRNDELIFRSGEFAEEIINPGTIFKLQKNK